MGFRAYQTIRTPITKKGKHKDLVMKGSDNAYVVNVFYICSAYFSTENTCPMDVVQRAVGDALNSTDDGGNDFEWDEEQVIAIKKKVKALYPEHKETPETIALLDAIMARDKSGYYDIVCF